MFKIYTTILMLCVGNMAIAGIDTYGHMSTTYSATSGNDMPGLVADAIVSGAYDLNASTYAFGQLSSEHRDDPVNAAFVKFKGISDKFDISIGRVFTPVGLFGNIYTNPKIINSNIKPLTVYNRKLEDTLASIDGIKLHANTRISDIGIDSNIYYGKPIVKHQKWLSDATFGTILSGSEFDTNYDSYGIRTSLKYKNTKVFLGYSKFYGKLNNESIDWSQYPIHSVLFDAKNYDVDINMFGIEQRIPKHKLKYRFEYVDLSTHNDLNIDFPKSYGWYHSLTHYTSSKLTTMIGYGRQYSNEDDKDGQSQYALFGVPNHSMYTEEFWVSARFNTNKYVKKSDVVVNFNHIKGSSWIVPDQQSRDTSDDTTNMFMISFIKYF